MPRSARCLPEVKLRAIEGSSHVLRALPTSFTAGFAFAGRTSGRTIISHYVEVHSSKNNTHVLAPCCIVAWPGSRAIFEIVSRISAARRQLGVKSTAMMAAQDEKRAAEDVSSAQESGDDAADTVLQSGNILGKLMVTSLLQLEEG